MNGWRETILKEFIPNISKLTLVADPDSLLTEEKLFVKLRQTGFDLIEFDDPIKFRYAYESKYRSIWDKGEYTDLVVILRLQNSDLLSLPYDLLQAGRKLYFNLGELFPNLSYPVIERIDRSLLDELYEAQLKSSPDRMGDNATMDFILRHVFGIISELIFSEVELLRSLLRLHYGKIRIPIMLAERLVEVLKNNKNFEYWPLEEIVPDSESFFAFLQERWPVFLSHFGISNHVQEKFQAYALKYCGPDYLPFDHQDIRVYIDNLFVERKLTPVDVAGLKIEDGSWFLSGIVTPDANDEDVRISRLFDLLEAEQISMESRYTDWISFAMKWAELSSLIHCGNNTLYKARLNEFGDKVNMLFADWLEDHYASLINLPPSNPAMLHHVPRRLLRDIEDKVNGRVALIVIDGLSLDQWVTVRNLIQRQNNDLVMRESATFAWIPTLTSVSRQSIFSGKPPIYFPSSINSTSSEEKLWKQFWQGHGVSKLDVAYKRGLGDGNVEAILDSLINPAQTKVVGLIIDKVDKIMHGMQLGSAGMHNQISQWCNGKFLVTLLRYLHNHGYEVWLTSDHGNIECNGKGRPSEGAIAESRGERVRVYPTPELRTQIFNSFTFAREWQPTGLPKKYFPLVTTGRDAFVNVGDSIVGHGGVAIEEVIVPLIKIEWRAR